MTTKTYRAIGHTDNKPISAADSLTELAIERTAPQGRDVLVRVRATAVNPIDTKLRRFSRPSGPHRILGFDAAGVVEDTGPSVQGFAPGDQVYYAGVVNRAGSNAQYQLVDERLIAQKPSTLTFADAAALPLTSIAAWECLFERLALEPHSTGTLLVVGGAGGVGSMAVQLARRTNVTVIATASEPASRSWVYKIGAHHHADPAELVEQVHDHAPHGVDFIITPFSSGRIPDYAELMRPYGAIVGLDDPDPPALAALKPKSVTWHWESMFTRPLFGIEPERHHIILDSIAGYVDQGSMIPPRTHILEGLSVATLREAHRIVEQSSITGKVVITVDP